MRAIALFTLALLALTGCDKLTGAADQQVADAEAIGFACRVSLKTPEDCMKENDAHRPSSILDGWKMADEDIKAGKLDPGMGSKPSVTLSETQAEEAAAGAAPATDTPAAEAAPAPAGAVEPATEEPKAPAQPAGK